MLLLFLFCLVGEPGPSPDAGKALPPSVQPAALSDEDREVMESLELLEKMDLVRDLDVAVELSSD